MSDPAGTASLLGEELFLADVVRTDEEDAPVASYHDREPIRRMMVFSGRSNPDLATAIGKHLGLTLGEVELEDVPERRALRPLRRVDPRRRRVPRAVVLDAGEPEPDGAAADGERGEARVGQADHRRHALVPVLARRQEVRARASRSARASSPTCCSRPASTACSRWTCTPARCRASSTSRSIT